MRSPRRCQNLVSAQVTAVDATFVLFKWCTKTQSYFFGSPWTRALAKTHMHLNFSPNDPLAPHLSPIPKDHDNILSWDQGWKSKEIGSWSYFLLCLLTQERDCFSFLLMFWLWELPAFVGLCWWVRDTKKILSLFSLNKLGAIFKFNVFHYEGWNWQKLAMWFLPQF